MSWRPYWPCGRDRDDLAEILGALEIEARYIKPIRTGTEYGRMNLVVGRLQGNEARIRVPDTG
jgi:hypothetical protein